MLSKLFFVRFIALEAYWGRKIVIFSSFETTIFTVERHQVEYFQ